MKHIKKSNLENLFKELTKIFPIQEHTNRDGVVYGTYPFIINNFHPHYQGEDAIIVGNDTEVREAKDGNFIYINYHDKTNESVVMSKKEILDFYEGQYCAYEFDTCDDKSIAFRKGYKKVLITLVGSINTKDEKVKIFKPKTKK